MPNRIDGLMRKPAGRKWLACTLAGGMLLASSAFGAATHCEFGRTQTFQPATAVQHSVEMTISGETCITAVMTLRIFDANRTIYQATFPMKDLWRTLGAVRGPEVERLAKKEAASISAEPLLLEFRDFRKLMQQDGCGYLRPVSTSQALAASAGQIVVAPESFFSSRYLAYDSKAEQYREVGNCSDP